jgi:hypothetical protein
MATAYSEPLCEPGPAAPEPQHTDSKAVQEENRQLKELVIALSKLVVKYVPRQN